MLIGGVRFYMICSVDSGRNEWQQKTCFEVLFVVVMDSEGLPDPVLVLVRQATG